MRIEHISNVDALGFVVAVLIGALLLYRLVPAGDALPPVRRTTFTDDEITAYDRALPKYLLAAFGALVVASVHFALKSVPAVQTWLADAGHGGHLVRDIANTHLTIVVGGTVSATALTWYVLPRVLRRPLATPRLAGASFWCTVVGAGGFYVTNVVVGLVTGRMEHAGRTSEQAEAALGAWKAVPVGLTATVMGIGYWTFVATVLITVVKARHVEEPGPQRHLAKFFVVGALGLFVGTVQGVIQVMPAQEDWLHAAAPAGEYIDPISHAHVNLVTGLLMIVAGSVLYWTRHPGRAVRDRRREQVMFAVLLVGSVGFYLTFVGLGFAEGRLIVDEGLSFDTAVDRLGWRHVLPLATFGSLTFVGIAAFLLLVVGRVRDRRVPAVVRPLVVASTVALGVGITQGLVQLAPPVKRFIEDAGQFGDMVANSHAQLNMLGGVILMLVAVAIDRSPHLLGAAVPEPVTVRVRRLVIPGVAVLYAGSMLTAVASGVLVVDGRLPRDHAVAHLLGPSLTVAGATWLAAGYVALTTWAWRATRAYRSAGRQRVRTGLRSYDGPTPAWLPRVRPPVLVAAEAVGACAGFPGIGWILSGRGTVGMPLAMIGPAMAWAILPIVMTADTPLSIEHSGALLVAAWIAVTAVLSTGALGVDVNRRLRRVREAAA